MSDGAGILERLLGVSLRPSERKLLVMKNALVEAVKKDPALRSALGKARKQLKSSHLRVRVDNMPLEFKEALEAMDSSGMPAANRVIASMIIFQIDSVFEELNGDG